MQGSESKEEKSIDLSRFLWVGTHQNIVNINSTSCDDASGDHVLFAKQNEFDKFEKKINTYTKVADE